MLTVTYAGELPAGPVPRLADPHELTAVGWWTVAELLRVDNCSPWVPPLLLAAASPGSSRTPTPKLVCVTHAASPHN